MSPPRPPKNATAPAPMADAKYCHTCGRVISPRKANPRTPPATPQKYCSDRCRREKPPSTGQGIETQIEDAFVRLLGNERERKIVKCEEVQRAIFEQGRGQLVSSTEENGGDGADGGGVQASDDEEEDDDDEEGGVRLPSSFEPAVVVTTAPEVVDGGGVSPHAYGLRVAKQREQVRQAARRGVAFGFCVAGESGDGCLGERRRVEAVQYGRVVEASFAKGEWGVRWKE